MIINTVRMIVATREMKFFILNSSRPIVWHPFWAKKNFKIFWKKQWTTPLLLFFALKIFCLKMPLYVHQIKRLVKPYCGNVSVAKLDHWGTNYAHVNVKLCKIHHWKLGTPYSKFEIFTIAIDTALQELLGMVLLIEKYEGNRKL